MKQRPSRNAAGALAAGLLLLPTILPAIDGRELHFRLRDGYAIVAEGSAGRLRNLNFIVDTGAVPSVVDQRIARRLKLASQKDRLSVFNGSVEAERVVLPSLELGPLRAESLPVLVEDLSSLGRALGVAVDGMIGLDVLGRSNFSIDYPKKRLRFGPFDQPGAVPAIPFEIGPGYLTVQIELERTPVRLMVDTGAPDLILFERHVRDRLPGIELLSQKVSGNLGGEVRLRRAKLHRATCGGTSLPLERASLMLQAADTPPDLDGLLGLASLGAKRVGFDFKNRTMSWEK